MPERVLRGRSASPGVGAGTARLLFRPLPTDTVVGDRSAEAERAEGALLEAGAELDAIAADLRAAGRAEEAEIVETGSLMAADPALAAGVRSRVLDDGSTAAAALMAVASEHADALAAIGDETLAARADDVVSLGRRAARIASGRVAVGPSGEPCVLVADDLGPADVAELDEDVVAIALAAGGVTAHAAIVARALALPMVVNLGLIPAEDGETLVVDGDAGEVVVAPAPERLAKAAAARARREASRASAVRERELPAITSDGREVTVLVNAAGAAEAGAGIEAGAAGIGLLRTELAFLEARAWPTAAEHVRALRPVLAEVGSATVRVLDFGGDKTPPFLRGSRERGIELLLRHPEALAAQLAAIVEAAADVDLRVMLPMVSGAADVVAVRTVLPGGIQVGAMIETAEAVAAVHEIAAASDFLSIGTNDLTHSILGSDRFAPGEAVTHHPQVLAAIARTVEAGAAIPVEVCGEAASDPITLPLLVGLGVDELSVGASRVGAVRRWVRALSYEEAREAARAALELTDALEVARLGRRVLLEPGEAGGESVDGGGRVAALGGQG